MEPDSPENYLKSIVDNIAAASAARAAAGAVASVQAAHMKSLIAEGMDPDTALELTARTSIALLEGVGTMIAGLASNGGELAKLVRELLPKGATR
jgi:hypothetical protein